MASQAPSSQGKKGRTANVDGKEARGTEREEREGGDSHSLPFFLSPFRLLNSAIYAPFLPPILGLPELPVFGGNFSFGEMSVSGVRFRRLSPGFRSVVERK